MTTIYSAGLRAQLAAETDRLSYNNRIITVLGASRTATFKSFVSAPSDWHDGWDAIAAFYAAPLTGQMVSQNGLLTNLGTVGAQTVRENADLSTRFAVVRIDGGGEYMQGTVGLSGQLGYDGLPVDFVLRRSPNGLYGISLNSAKFAAPEDLAPAPDVQVTFARLHASATQAGNFVAPMLGCPFKQGDIPAGSYPHFKLPNGNACPATLMGITTWPDGSMKFCAALLNIPDGIASAGTLDIQIRSGGTMPAAGSRTTSDFAALNINVELVGVDGLTGTWTASLNDAIALDNDVTLIGSGPAGAVWRIGGEVRDASAAAHGQLYCWHYVAALSNANGTFKGIRYLGKVGQPWHDAVALGAPPARHRDCTLALKKGATTVRNLTGMTSTETVSTTIRILQYASVFTAGPDAKWDYFHGDGSATPDAAVRVSLNTSYIRAARLVPPYDMTTVVDAHPSYDYVANGKGPVERRDIPGTGERPELGLFPSWSARHIIRQDESHERAVRVGSMIASSWRFAHYNRSTKKIAPYSQTRASFPTLGPIRSTWRSGVSYPSGIDIPTVNTSLWFEDQGHQAACHYWAYLFCGEPQMLDMQCEMAAHTLSRLPQGVLGFNLTMPITHSSIIASEGGRNVKIGTHPVRYGAICFAMSNGLREAGWGFRDLVHAVTMMPDVSTDGSELKLFLTDCLTSCRQAFVDYVTDLPLELKAQGTFQIEPKSGTFYGSSNPWQRAFFDWSMAHGADILPSANADIIRTHLAKGYIAKQQDTSIGCQYVYRDNFWEGNTLVPVEKATYQSSTTIDFVSSTGRGTVRNDGEDAPLVNSNQWNVWTPQENDIIAFGVEGSVALPNPSMVLGQRCYLKNVSGRSFELSLTPGGATVTIPADITISGAFLNPKVASPSSEFMPAGNHYANIIQSAMTMLRPTQPAIEPARAAGMAYINAFLANGMSFRNEPKYRLSLD